MKVTSQVITRNSKTAKPVNTRHAKVRKGSTPKGKRKSSSKSSGGSSFFQQLKSPRMIQVYGVLLMCFALLLFVSIVSFYFHAHNNIHFVLSDGQDASHNIARTVGAYLAYFFVNDLFGVSSIGFAFLFFLYGWRLTVGKSPVNLLKTTINVILTMAWLSMFLGLFVRPDGDYAFVAGYFGTLVDTFLLASVQKAVTYLIVAVLLVIILILCYDIPLSEWFGRIQTSIEERKQNPPAERKTWKQRKQTTAQETDTRHEDLDDLYVTDHGCLSKEYHGANVVEFETEKDTDEKTEYSNSPFTPVKEDVEVPFELVSNEVKDETFGSEDDLEEDVEEVPEEEPHELTAEEVRNLEPYDPRKELSTYEFPPIDLLNDYPAKEATEELMKRELLDNKKRIEATLKSFGIPIRKITATIGPTVTLYEIIPDEGVRISKIKNLEDDIALSLAALGIRIIAPIPGRGTIGIEVPNKNSNIVSMKEIISSDKFQNNKYELPIGLGRTISNEAFVVDLAKMPHLLVAGATGQGKSVGLNAIITSLLYTKHPAEMKFVLIDPQKVEFTLYSAIENYYLAKLPDEEEAIINDVKKVVHVLNSLCKEMDDRYDLLKMARMRNIKEYNAKFCSRGLSPAMGHRYLPYIVLIIDEFGDLIMTAGREVEQPLARLAQLARAIGIHLVIATQRPSVNIITGSIKANFPARIAFRVQSGVDSKTILDTTGANQLIGKGDMLISTGSDLIRLQCAFVDTPEVEKIANYIQEKSELSPLLHPYELPDVPDPAAGDAGNFDDGDDDAGGDAIDSLFVDAAVLVVQTQQGSTSLIQRRMKLGYNRAGRIMDQLSEFGIVGKANGSKPREVLMKTEAQLRDLLASKGLL